MSTQPRLQPELPQSALAEEIGRICESRAFRRSLQQQRLLRHLVERKLCGDLGALKEMALGIDFFRRDGRRYDPKSDAVVRIEAGRLRQRLERYYAEEGQTAAWEISLDRGSYVPVIRPRASAAVRLANMPALVVCRPVAPTAGVDEAQGEALWEEALQTLRCVPNLRLHVAGATDAAGFEALRREVRTRMGARWVLQMFWRGDHEIEFALSPTEGRDGVQRLVVDLNGQAGPELHRHLRGELLRHIVPSLAPGEAETLARASRAEVSADARAHDLYLRARYILSQRYAALLPKAIGFLEEATRLDPQFGNAWAELARAYSQRRHLVFTPEERDPRPAILAAERAIALAPENGQGYAILAKLAYTAEFDWPKADRLFGQALAVAPRDHAVRSAYASFLMFSARFEEALREYDVLHALDPLDLGNRTNRAALYFYCRHYARAETLLLQTIEIAPQDVYALLMLADTYAASGDPQASLAMAEQMLKAAPDYANGYIYKARALLLAQRGEEADAVLVEAHRRFDTGVITEYEEAMLAMARGDDARALAELEAYAARRGNGAHCIVVDPTFAGLHEQSAWRDMLRRVGLPELRPAPLLPR